MANGWVVLDHTKCSPNQITKLIRKSAISLYAISGDDIIGLRLIRVNDYLSPGRLHSLGQLPDLGSAIFLFVSWREGIRRGVQRHS